MEGFRFCHSLRVRYSEIDGQKIVMNSNYMVYTDIAITEYMREVLGSYYDLMLQYNEFEITLVKAELEFKRPARFDDIINIYCKAVHLGNSSMNLQFTLVREKDGELLVTANNHYVVVDLVAGRSRPIPPEIRRCILDFEGLEG